VYRKEGEGTRERAGEGARGTVEGVRGEHIESESESESERESERESESESESEIESERERETKGGGGGGTCGLKEDRW
jgi:hypothetical protein